MIEREYSRLLQRQIRKHVPPDLVQAITPFLIKVNESYDHYEQDRQLLARAMEMSSDELKGSNRDLLKSNESLESFNYAAAHDLKNHALNIQGMVVLLRKYWNTDPQKLEQVRSFLDHSLQQFLKTVHGFLYVSKAQAHRDKDGATVDRKRLQELVELECRHLVERKGAHIIWTQEGQERCWPEHLLKTLLVNLVTNSIKYSQPGVPPRVEVLLKSNDDTAVVRVKDNGTGIDLKKNEKHLFALFSRLNNTQGEEGTGVGLYLVKKLVERENGALRTESEPGKGTIMTITFTNLTHGAS
jgi:signal transduction histidine kinase